MPDKENTHQLTKDKPVPFMRPELGDAEIDEVADTLRSGWLTTGPKTKRFEDDFAAMVRGKYSVALNSCTAALHLGAVALGLKAGQAVLVPTMTFAATAEIIQYTGAVPILVDCEPDTGNMDLADAERKIEQFRSGLLTFPFDISGVEVVGIIPVHVGGFMLDVDALRGFADRHGLWIIEDAAHSFPSAWRRDAGSDWVFCGENTSAVSCFSFYANKTITTGEGGMAVTDDPELAEQIRLLSLHGLSRDAWGRYTGAGPWDYQIVTAGYKYNLTDIAAAIGIHQVARAEEMRIQREIVAKIYLEEFSDVPELELPPDCSNRIHSWHLFPLRLCLERLTIDRNEFIEQLRASGIGYSVHWRPLHLHPHYLENYRWDNADFPVATDLWPRLISLPIFPGIRTAEIKRVVGVVREICHKYSVRRSMQVA